MLSKSHSSKKINVELMDPDDRSRSSLYHLLEDLIKEHHAHLIRAKIALAWQKSWKPDKDNSIILGQCIRASDLSRELADWDFVILLNKSSWQNMGPEQRLALLDHELCHAQQATDKDGNPRRDERGRLVWRLRKHDIEEFHEIVARHGLYKSDLEAFVRAAREAKETPLFPRAAKEA